MGREVVVVLGPPASGKSTVTEPLIDQGYINLNRDNVGGKLDQLSVKLEAAHLADPGASFVLDNTYATVESRASLIATCQRLDLPIRCLWMQTNSAQAQFLAALRQLRRYGKLLAKADYKLVPYKYDPNMFPPGAQFAYWKRAEGQDPTTDEGFARVERVPFVLDLGPEHTNGAVMFDYDSTLRVTRSGEILPRAVEDVVLMPGRREKVQALADAGVILLGASNQSGVARPTDHPFYVSEEVVRACFERTNELLGVDIDFLFAKDRAGVPTTFWRKPCPGMGVVFIEKYKLDPSKVLYVGDLKSDATFAERCGFGFAWAHEYFV